MEVMTIVIIIVMIAGAAPLIVCINKMRLVNAFKNKSVITNATVTRVEERHHYKTGIIYRATVEYKTGTLSPCLYFLCLAVILLL